MSEDRVSRRDFLRTAGRVAAGLALTPLSGDSSHTDTQINTTEENEPSIGEIDLSLAEYSHHRNITITNLSEQGLRLDGKNLDVLLSQRLDMEGTSINITINGSEKVEIDNEPQLITTHWSFDNRVKKEPVKLKSGQTVDKLIPPENVKTYRNLSVTIYPSIPIDPLKHIREYSSFPTDLKSDVIKLLGQNPNDALSVIATAEIWNLIGLNVKYKETTTADVFRMAMSQLEQGIKLFSLKTSDTTPMPEIPKPMPEYDQT